MRLTDSAKLWLVVVAAMAVRVLTLWIGRPEFTGWLNHTYYYFVQVRGILEGGGLAYPDMPILFYLTSLAAAAAGLVGVGQSEAIVGASRLIMCIVPALIPVAVFQLARHVSRSDRLRWTQWVLVALSGFLPLTIRHLPEFAQKNMLGLLLLAVFMFAAMRWFDSRTRSWLGVSVLVAILIVLSHFGTFAALLVYLLAALPAYAIVTRDRTRTMIASMAFVVTGAISAMIVYLFDPQRFNRILVYATDSVGNSLIGSLATGSGQTTEVLLSLVGILLFYGVLYLLYRLYLRRRNQLSEGRRIVWLSQILFCGLLVFPLLDQQLMGRLAIFLTIPLLLILLFNEQYVYQRRWLRTGLHLLLVVVVAAMAFGELMSSRVHNRHHEAIYADIQRLQSETGFSSGDLVVTMTGAEHICNWFFGVKAGVITTLSRDDFATYDRILVLNPFQGKLNYSGIYDATATSDANRYLFMRRNIPRPELSRPMFESKHIEVFEVTEAPDEWLFDDDGDWLGYRVPEAGITEDD